MLVLITWRLAPQSASVVVTTAVWTPAPRPVRPNFHSPFMISSAEVAALSPDAQIPYKLKQGRLICGLELKLVDDAGERLPHDGRTPGRLLIKGGTICSGYFGNEGGDVLDAVVFPEAVSSAEGAQTTLRAHAGAGEDNEFSSGR